MNIATTTFRGALAAGVLILGACAAAPLAPNDSLKAADIAVANAEKDRAAEYAPLEMRLAHEKLSSAHANPDYPDDKSRMQQRWQADEARADAELASAKARLAKAEAVNLELQKNSNTLRQETQRDSGV